MLAAASRPSTSTGLPLALPDAPPPSWRSCSPSRPASRSPSFVVGAMVSATDSHRRRDLQAGQGSAVAGHDGRRRACCRQDGSRPVRGGAGGRRDAQRRDRGVSRSRRRCVFEHRDVGLGTGYLAARLIGTAEDRLVEADDTVVLAYGSYLWREGWVPPVGGDGHRDRRPSSSERGTRAALIATGTDAVDTVTRSSLAYLLTAVVFLLVGLAIPPARLLASIGPITWAIVGALVGRAIVVQLLLGVARFAPGQPRSRDPPPGRLATRDVLERAARRVAVGAALALPARRPGAGLFREGDAFGVVLFTLVVRGTTIGRVAQGQTGGLDSAPQGSNSASPVDSAPSIAAVRGLSSSGLAQDLVDLVAILSTDRRPFQPFDELDIVREISPSDQPAYRPKLRTLPDGFARRGTAWRPDHPARAWMGRIRRRPMTAPRSVARHWLRGWGLAGARGAGRSGGGGGGRRTRRSGDPRARPGVPDAVRPVKTASYVQGPRSAPTPR